MAKTMGQAKRGLSAAQKELVGMNSQCVHGAACSIVRGHACSSAGSLNIIAFKNLKAALSLRPQPAPPQPPRQLVAQGGVVGTAGAWAAPAAWEGRVGGGVARVA